MKPTLDDALRALDEATAFAKSFCIDLTEDYLRLIANVEALPQNRSGADKSHVAQGQRMFLEFFRNARPAPPKP